MANRQQRVVSIGTDVFGAESMKSRRERVMRFFEEACELAQACGLSQEDCQLLLNFEFSRPLGDIPQEVGGVGVTLFALTDQLGYNLEELVDIETNRVEAKKTQIRAKAALKPDKIFSVRPIAPEAA